MKMDKLKGCLNDLIKFLRVLDLKIGEYYSAVILGHPYRVKKLKKTKRKEMEVMDEGSHS